jgi:RHS repeat-associated protein
LKTEVLDAKPRVKRPRQSGPPHPPQLPEYTNNELDVQALFNYNNLGDVTSISRWSFTLGSSEPFPTVDSFFGYDGANRLTTIWSEWVGSLQDVALYFFTYDVDGRITKYDTTHTEADGHENSDIINYTYDANDQLLLADRVSGADETFGFDNNGNRTMSGYNTSANNQLDAGAGYTFQYDFEGNVTGVTRPDGSTTNYIWDHRNRLTLVTHWSSGGGFEHVYYTYDARDRRAKVDDAPAAAQWHAYDGQDLIGLYTAGGAAVEQFVHGPLGSAPLVRQDSWSDNWLFTDHQGSVRAWADPASGGVAFVTYGAFGQTVSGTPGRFGYAGYEAVPGAKGLLRAGARHYEPVVGRFVSQDPVGFEGGDANLYRYVFNSPLNYTDPTGMTAARGGSPQFPLVDFADAFSVERLFGGPQQSGRPAPAAGQGRAGTDVVWFAMGPGAQPPLGWNPSPATMEESARMAREYYAGSLDSLNVIKHGKNALVYALSTGADAANAGSIAATDGEKRLYSN